MKPLISVVVPIYGTEKYLENCLQSILGQTLKNIEVICVDDCSPDNSAKIVEQFQQKDSRVNLIRHKVNTGQGGARNTAIKAAKADFIASVDSDDSIKPNMLEMLWEESNNGEFDIVCCGFSRVNDKGAEIHESKYIAREICLDSTLENKTDINIFTIMNPSFWNKLWRKSLFIDNNIFFPNKIYYQDMATTPLVVAKSKKIKFINKSLYNYLVRDGSVTNSFSEKHIIDYFKVFDVLLYFLIDNKLMEYYREDFIAMINRHISFHANNVLKSGMEKDQMNQYLRHLLMLKVSYLENFELLSSASCNDLIGLINSTQSLKKILAPTPRHQDQKNIQNELRVQSELREQKRLSNVQKIGSKLFGFVFRVFITPRQLAKLRLNPESFFRDSKSKFTRSIGMILRII